MRLDQHRWLYEVLGAEIGVVASYFLITALFSLNVKGEQITNVIENNDFSNTTEYAKYIAPDLSNKNLYRINAQQSFLVGANLTNSNLSKGDFSYADLRGSNFTKANIEDAVFKGTNLKDALGLTKAQLQTVKSCENAILPAGFTVEDCKRPIPKEKPLNTVEVKGDEGRKAKSE